MSKQLSEETKITLDLKKIGMILEGVATDVGMLLELQADMDDAKTRP